MIRISRLHVLLFFAAAAVLAACGGGSSTSKTPAASSTANPTTAQAGSTARSAQTTIAAATRAPAATIVAAATAIAVATLAADPDAAGTATAEVPPSLPLNITVLPDGTATNSEGTPVVLPTAPPAPTVSAQNTPSSQGTVISISAPANASGDFEVNVNVTGTVQPYIAFNVYVTFDPAILSPIVIKPGTALSESPDSMFCARAPATTGATGLGCTVIQGPSAATNGTLAIIRFRQVGTGTSPIHLNTVADGGSTTGTYTSTPRPGSQPVPDFVTLVDGSVTVP